VQPCLGGTEPKVAKQHGMRAFMAAQELKWEWPVPQEYSRVEVGGDEHNRIRRGFVCAAAVALPAVLGIAATALALCAPGYSSGRGFRELWAGSHESSTSSGQTLTDAILLAEKPRQWVPDEWKQRSEAGQLLYSADPAHLKAWLKPNLGNGYMGTQFGRPWMYLSGVYNGYKVNSQRARVPVPLVVKPRGRCTGMALDFERGVVEEVFVWPKAHVLVRTYFHQALPHIAVTELEIDNSKGADPFSFQVEDHLASKFPDFATKSFLRKQASTCLSLRTRKAESPRTKLIDVALCRANPDPVYSVGPGETRRVLLHAAVWTSRDAPSPSPSVLTSAQMEYGGVAGREPEEVYKQHLAGMQQLWRGGIEIDGNLELARHVNSSWWNLLLSYRWGQNMSSSPGGLANNCYKGHSFWDIEQFMWPNLLMFQPQLAAASLQYRFDRRGPAQANAAKWKKAGLKFPWESAVTGEEVCPWPGGAKEIHINGDISLAFWQYWQATADGAWLRSIGWPVLRGVAEFWASWAEELPNNGFTVRGVVDVDERAVNVTDSSYTNAVAMLAVANGIRAAKLVGQEQSVGSSWENLGASLRLPMDEHGLHHLEHATAKAGSGLGIIMLQYPLGIPVTEEVRRNDLDFYSRSWPNGNAMFWWDFVINWLHLGEPGKAAKYLRKTTQKNVFGPFNIWSETAGGGGCPNFVTGAGAFLQAMWAGYGGIRLSDGDLSFHNPRVPPDSTELRFRALAYRGSLVNVRITPSTILLQLHNESPRGAPLLAAAHDGGVGHSLKHGAEPLALPSAGVVSLFVAPGRDS